MPSQKLMPSFKTLPATHCQIRQIIHNQRCRKHLRKIKLHWSMIVSSEGNNKMTGIKANTWTDQGNDISIP
jgi:hypothetical protein